MSFGVSTDGRQQKKKEHITLHTPFCLGGFWQISLYIRQTELGLTIVKPQQLIDKCCKDDIGNRNKHKNKQQKGKALSGFLLLKAISS